jgi:type II secretory pathway component GspD/PulD (secretin)
MINISWHYIFDSEKIDFAVDEGFGGSDPHFFNLTKQGYPQIRTREATSSLRVRDGGSVVMGGLLSREERDGRRSIPWLSNIPLLGGLGESRDRHRGMTEIVMIVTAHVVEE